MLVAHAGTKHRDRAGGGAGGAKSPPTFVLFKIKIKESSNKIAEEISLVRNGVKLHLTLAKVDADIKSNVSNDNY